MAPNPSTHSPGVFVLTKLRLILALSLVFTWWIASLLPHYQPIIRAQFRSRLDEARQKIPSVKVDWRPTEDPRAAYNASKLAMIIEPRVMPHLVPQLLHMVAVVPPDWRFLFIGSERSVTMLGRSAAVKHQQVVGKLDLMVLPDPWDVSSKELVYRTLTDMRFYDEFLPGVEWLLKYEYDSIMCANSEVSLNEWLEWDWAGAPKTADDRFAGNGGLSLRRVSAIRKVLSFQARYNDTEPEDEWFGKRLYIMPDLRVASGLEGALAVENVYIEHPMGFHIQGMGEDLPADVWGDYEIRRSMLEYCPELYTVMNAKFERERCPGDTKDGVIHPTPEEQAEEKQRLQEEAEARRKTQEDTLKKLQEERMKKEEERKKKEVEEAQKKVAESLALPKIMDSPEASDLDTDGSKTEHEPGEGAPEGSSAHEAHKPPGAGGDWAQDDSRESPASQAEASIWPAEHQPVAATDGKPSDANIQAGSVADQPVADTDDEPALAGLDGNI